jgi:hypothetical protein
MTKRHSEGVCTHTIWEATLLFSALSVVFLSFVNLAAYSDSLNPGIYSHDSSPFDVPYKDWIAKWWDYNVDIGAEVHPRDNFSPERCNLDQKQVDPVYYLPDNLSGEEQRNCSVPAGKAILAPLLTMSCWDDNTDPNLKTEQGLQECSREGNEYGVVSATLDGRKILNVEQYRTTSDVFNITVAKDNAFQSLYGTFPSIADGFFVFLEPLSPGKHSLVLEQSVLNPTQPEYNYASKTIYDLTSKP